MLRPGWRPGAAGLQRDVARLFAGEVSVLPVRVAGRPAGRGGVIGRVMGPAGLGCFGDQVGHRQRGCRASRVRAIGLRPTRAGGAIARPAGVARAFPTVGQCASGAVCRRTLRSGRLDDRRQCASPRPRARWPMQSSTVSSVTPTPPKGPAWARLWSRFRPHLRVRFGHTAVRNVSTTLEKCDRSSGSGQGGTSLG